jgi:hypothetical protein
MNEEELLAELEDILRNTPSRQTISHETDENYSWFGRVAAALEAWDMVKGRMARIEIDNIQNPMSRISEDGLRKTLTTLHQARHQLRMKTTGPLSVSVSTGKIFDYFDEIRKILETANNDVLFVDPYLDAEFVSRYLPNIKSGVSIRLLARERLQTLLPSVNAYRVQSQQLIEVRSAPGFHDRYIFVDRNSCYQSGASFKDGAKKSPTTVTQITDAFTAMHSTYEDMWSNAKHEL